MITAAAIGDAYGAGFEFQSLEFIAQHNDLKQYRPHGHYTEIYKRYTDDTQMALAELLLENDENWTAEMVADKFVAVFHRDKRRGYSDRVYNVLDASKNGKNFLQIIDNQSGGNGSAMRAYTLGYLKDVEKLLHFATIQAKVSHNTEEGITAAKRIALTIHYFLYDIQGISLFDFVEKYAPSQGKYEIVSPIDMHGFPTTNAVLKIVSEADDMAQCLQQTIAYGGDTDTTAALCMAILSVKKNTKQNLPNFLFDELENGQFGRDYLVNIDKMLKMKFL
jgi:ADP-ribosyl-[dinitrogen reductase] hydrolase